MVKVIASSLRKGNIVELGLVSEVLLREGRVYFSITVSPERAEELEPVIITEKKADTKPEAEKPETENVQK